ncbi:MAG: hypothetical protein ABJ059_16470, partial [Hyphomicrobiales bacterium]
MMNNVLCILPFILCDSYTQAFFLFTPMPACQLRNTQNHPKQVESRQDIYVSTLGPYVKSRCIHQYWAV